MKVVLLAATDEQARQHAHDALVDKRDVVVPRSEEQVKGLILGETDLIMEFPGFRDREHAEEIVRWLLDSFDPNGAGPVWRKAGSAA